MGLNSKVILPLIFSLILVSGLVPSVLAAPGPTVVQVQSSVGSSAIKISTTPSPKIVAGSGASVKGLASPHTVHLQSGDAVVYENGIDDPTTGFLDHTYSNAEDFQLANAGTISDVHFILVEYQGFVFDKTVQYAILGDNAGPDSGNVLASGDAINIQTTDLGPGPLGERISVGFDLQTPVSLSSGVTYWLWVHTGSGYDSPPNYVLEASTAQVGACTVHYLGTDFHGTPFTTCDGQDIWFQLTEKILPVGGMGIPIDTTALLLAGIQGSSLWMIPAIVIAGAGIGIFSLKRSKKSSKKE